MTRQELVANLAKPGAAILRDLTPVKAHLLHAAIGMMTEASELLAGVSNEDGENVVEEIGDILFYCEMVTQVYGVDLELPDISATPYPTGGARDWACEVVGELGAAADLIKKIAIYGQEIHRDMIYEHLVAAYGYLRVIAEQQMVTLWEAGEMNTAKLLKRYPAGRYSDRDAAERKDK